MRRMLRVLACGVAAGWACAPAGAADFFWNGAAGGGGSWTAAGASWATPTADTTPLVPWVNANSAVFGGSGGTVTLDSSGLTATGLVFAADGYTLAGPNGLTLAGTVLNTLAITSGVATIGANVTATAGITYKYGAGTLNLAGNWSGAGKELSIRGGTVNVSGTTLAIGKFLIGAAGIASTVNWSNGTGTVSGNYWGVGDGASGTMNISGGAVSVTGTGSSSLFLGNGSGVLAQMTVSGGSVTDAGVNLWIGTGYNGAQTTSSTGILTLAGGNFTFSGSGTIKLSNAAGQNGTINLNGGVFTLNGKSITAGAGTAAVNFDGGTLRLSATNAAIFGAGLIATINGGGAVVDTGAFPGTIGVGLLAGTGSGGLTKQGTGALTLSGDNTYTGPTAITAGTLRMGSATALGAGATRASFGTGTLDLNGFSPTLSGVSGSGGFITNSGAPAILTINTTNQSTGPAVSGDLNLVIAKGAGTWQILPNANLYTGTTVINSAAVLSIANPGGLGATAAGTTVDGTLELKSAAASMTFDPEPLTLDNGGSLVGHNNGATRSYGWTGPVSLPVGTAAIDVQTNVDLTLSGAISGNGGLVKTSPGLLAIPAGVTNTYAGPTTVAAGTLSVDGVHTGGGLITVAGGAALRGAGSVGSVSVQPGATLAPGNSIGTFAASGDVAILGRLSIELDGAGVGSADFLQVGGALDIGGATVDFLELSPLDDPAYVIASYGSLGGTAFGAVTNLPDGYQIDYHHGGGNQIALTVVPEPSSLGLLGLVSAAFLLRRRLRG